MWMFLCIQIKNDPMGIIKNYKRYINIEGATKPLFFKRISYKVLNSLIFILFSVIHFRNSLEKNTCLYYNTEYLDTIMPLTFLSKAFLLTSLGLKVHL